jgi:hypothetical protein
VANDDDDVLERRIAEAIEHYQNVGFGPDPILASLIIRLVREHDHANSTSSAPETVGL